jgi:hypothetical protein
MFTNVWRLAAIATVAVFLRGAIVCSQEQQPLPQPPLQPPPKRFELPKPKLGIPELIPVAAQVPVPRPATQERPAPPVGVPAPKPNDREGVTIGAQAARETRGTADNTKVTGKIVRVEKDHMIVETTGGGVMTLYFDPNVKLMRESAKIAYSDLPPGATFTALYTPRGERFWVTTLNLVPAAPSPIVEIPAPAPPVVVVKPAPPPVVKVVPVEVPKAVIVVSPTAYETEIVRVIAPDQLVVRNESGSEFTVYMTPRTRYMMGDAAAAFVDLRPGMRIRVDDEVQADRHFARQVIGVRR